MRHLFLILIVTSMLLACNNNNQNQNANTNNGNDTENSGNAVQKSENESENTTNKSKTTQNKTKTELNIVSFNKQEAAKLPHTGDIVYGKAWTDNNGENMLIMSENIVYVSDMMGSNDSRDIHAYHYAKSGSDYKLIREIKDFQKDCEGFNLARFMERSLEITDLDKDGYAEITFAYRLGCHLNMNEAIGLKLIMLENGDKYAIRGNVNGETNIDPGFDNAPAEFLQHAKNLWTQQQNPELSKKPRLYKLEKIMKYKNANLGGVEPNWTVKLFDTYLEFSTNMGQNPQRFDYERIEDNLEKNKMITIHAQRSGNHQYKQILVQITEKSCSDGMSEKDYPLDVYVSHAQKSYRGCGGY